LFIDVVSADEVKTFKPNPSVYEHFLQRSNALKNAAWLVSSNPFDVIGAMSVGMHAAWLQRTQASIFDPWEIEPTVTITSLMELQKGIGHFENVDN